MTIKIEFQADTFEEMREVLAKMLGSASEVPAAPAKEEPETAEEPAAEEPTQAYTMTDVRAFLGDLRKRGKKEAVSGLIKDLGYEKFTDIPEEKYAELMEKARAL